MTAMETVYNGVRYRSRTEARWAVFMTEVGCPFDYEPEGFDLGAGIAYIPDFWLPTCNGFLEIKPSYICDGRESPTERFVEVTGFRIYTIYGQPKLADTGEYTGVLQLIIEYDNQRKVAEDESYWFCRCKHCGRVEIHFDARADRIDCKCPRSAHGDKGYNPYDAEMCRAYSKAINAFRFKKGGGNAGT